MRVGVAYATNFGSLSPGGIQSFIASVGRHAPADADVTYLGAGHLEGAVPRPQDDFASILRQVPATGAVNTRFSSALWSRRRALRDFDVVLLHRAEHAIPLAGRRVHLTLHGGSFFAALARTSPFSLAYPVVESLAVAVARTTLSVAPRDHWAPTRVVGAPVAISTCYDERVFFRGSAPRDQRLYVTGRLVPEKRIDVALRAAALLKWPVDVIGAGPEHPALRSLASHLGVDATFRGQLTQPAIADLYRERPGVFVMTSRFEGFPVAMLEALACGLNAVVMDAPGLRFAAEQVGAPVARTAEELARRARDLSEAPAPNVDAFSSAVVGARYWASALDAASR